MIKQSCGDSCQCGGQCSCSQSEEREGSDCGCEDGSDHPVIAQLLQGPLRKEALVLKSASQTWERLLQGVCAELKASGYVVKCAPNTFGEARLDLFDQTSMGLKILAVYTLVNDLDVIQVQATRQAPVVVRPNSRDITRTILTLLPSYRKMGFRNIKERKAFDIALEDLVRGLRAKGFRTHLEAADYEGTLSLLRGQTPYGTLSYMRDTTGDFVRFTLSLDHQPHVEVYQQSFDLEDTLMDELAESLLEALRQYL